MPVIGIHSFCFPLFLFLPLFVSFCMSRSFTLSSSLVASVHTYFVFRLICTAPSMLVQSTEGSCWLPRCPPSWGPASSSTSGKWQRAMLSQVPNNFFLYWVSQKFVYLLLADTASERSDTSPYFSQRSYPDPHF